MDVCWNSVYWQHDPKGQVPLRYESNGVRERQNQALTAPRPQAENQMLCSQVPLGRKSGSSS